MDALHARLHASREEIFGIAQAMKGEPEPAPELQHSAGEFPQSRLMKVLLGRQARVLLSGTAVAVGMLRPKLLGSAARLAPVLRPVIMKYLLPTLLGRR
jgi:hypothetical protein